MDVSVDLRIRHTWVGDLVVGLTDPSGARAVLWNREGGSQQNLELNGVVLTGQLAQNGANGTWILDVSDHAAMDTGTLETWTINLDCR
jgi:subtilisin-like proprotein convertase family protein